MRYPKEHKEQTRDRLVTEASRAIRSSGIASVSLSEIMGRAGLTNGGFYGYFPSKDALIAEAVGEMFKERYQRWLGEADSADAGELLERFVDFYLSWDHVASAETGCPIPTLAGTTPQMAPITRDEVASGVLMATKGVTGILARLGVAHEDAQARLLMAELVGAVTLARLASNRSEAERTLEVSRRRAKDWVGGLRSDRGQPAHDS